MLLDRYRELGMRGGHRPERWDVLRGAQDRFLPTFASTIAVAALVLPAVVLGPVPGLELVQPLAVVTLGGLVTCLAVVLFLLPVLYQHITPDLDHTEIDKHDTWTDRQTDAERLGGVPKASVSGGTRTKEAP
jgi:Cu/Ag efflux pump CusA